MRPAWLWWLWWLAVLSPAAAEPPGDWFGLQVVDETTGRGVPLVKVRTVNEIEHFTDSAGWIAFQEPGLMNRDVFFHLESAGYERAADGFGQRGVRVLTKPGATTRVTMRRTQLAERLVRLTGQGIYRDSALLRLPVPLAEPHLNASVLGQDSVQAVPYGKEIFWLWGDTNLPAYPLGNFRTTAATTAADAPPDRLDFRYFTEPRKPQVVRGMVRETEPGAVWLFGLLTVPDAHGRPALVAHFSRNRRLGDVVEHGLVRFDEATGFFEKAALLDRGERWRHPRGNAVRSPDAAGDFYYFAAPFAATRVAARLDAVLDVASYEALAWDGKSYVWSRELSPTTQAQEAALIRSGSLPGSAARYSIHDAASGVPVALHGASIVWNEFRQRWILIGVEEGSAKSPSYLGEVWYAEAPAITGPWRRAIRIATHPRFSFYNPRQHPFFATDGGRFIFFEGTYTTTFANNPHPTPRYEYNQLLYRLDLADERLRAAAE